MKRQCLNHSVRCKKCIAVKESFIGEEGKRVNQRKDSQTLKNLGVLDK